MTSIRTFTLPLFVAAMLTSSPGHATVAGSFSTFMAKITGRSGTVSVGKGGTPIPTKPTQELTPGGGWAQAGNFGVAGGVQAADGFVIAGRGTMTIGNKSVEYAGRASLAKDSVIGGLLGCLSGHIAGCLIGAATPIALHWIANSGGRINSQSGELERKDPSVCTVAPCREYAGYLHEEYFSSITAACEHIAAGFQRGSKSLVYVSVGHTVDGDGFERCLIQSYESNGKPFKLIKQLLGKRTVAPADEEKWLPSSMDDIAPYMFKTPVEPGLVKELIDAGVPVIQREEGEVMPSPADARNKPALEVSPWAVEGPVETTGPKTERVLPDGTKISEQEKTGWSYEGDRITRGETKTTTTTTRPDGSVETETKETSKDDPFEPEPTDSALPEIPELYRRKYPDGMVGIYDDYKDRLKNTSLVQLASSLMPSAGSSGSCPSWPVNLNLSSWAAFGVHDVAPPCWIWDVAKAILILSALLLARALIFGG